MHDLPSIHTTINFVGYAKRLRAHAKRVRYPTIPKLPIVVAKKANNSQDANHSLKVVSLFRRWNKMVG